MKVFKSVLLLTVFCFLASGVFSQGEGSGGLIKKPGETAVAGLGEVLIAEDLIGSYVMNFSGIQGPESKVPSLTREETNASGSGIGSYDELETLYSGKIYSLDKQGEEQVFIEFQDKTPEQLSRMEVEIASDVSSEVPPNIHGVIASNLAQISDKYPPEFVGQLFGEIISRIAKIKEKDCNTYFNKVFEELEIIRNEESPDFPQDIYEKVVQTIDQIKGETCQGGYSLFLNLEAKATSKGMEQDPSDDAGKYEASIKVHLSKTQ